MTHIAVFTGTRAEYGLLYWLMREIMADPGCRLSTLVSGGHLSPEFGLTWRDIMADGFEITEKVEMTLSSDSRIGTAKSIGLGILGYADALERISPDVLVVLGDRFEALAVAQAARVLGVPVAHLHGGELSEGAYDDAFRHAITKLADFHFVAAELYRDRVIQLGEDPARVHCVGAFGLDHIVRGSMIPFNDLLETVPLSSKVPYCLATYHPVTQGYESPAETADAIMKALLDQRDLQVLATYPNADFGGRAIIEVLETWHQRAPERLVLAPNLGFRRYLSAVAHAQFVIGNSSSGLIEVPAFKIPTINVGIRQAGRLAGDSVIHSGTSSKALSTAIQTARSERMRALCAEAIHPYLHGDAAGLTRAILTSSSLTQKTRFYDIMMPGGCRRP